MPIDYSKLIGDGKCALCRGPLGHVFRRIRIDTGVIDVRHMKELDSLANLTGSAALAEIFDPRGNEPLVRFTTDVDPDAGTLVCLCLDCFCSRAFDPGVLEETVNAREQAIQQEAGGQP